MAFLGNNQEDEENNNSQPAPVNQEEAQSSPQQESSPQPQQDQQQQQSSNPMMSGQSAMASSAPSAGLGGGATQKSTPKATSSGAFTNLNNYITANEGNDAQMGQAIRGNVDNQATQATAAGDTYRTTTQDVTNSATVNLDQKALGSFKKDAIDFTNNPQRGTQNRQTFGQQINAQYAGPNTYNEGALSGVYADAANKFGQVDQSVNLATEGGIEGRGQLLGDAYNRSDYGQGQKQLDSFILGAGQGGMAELAKIADTYKGFGEKNLSGLQSAATGMIDMARETTDATREAWTGEYGAQNKGVWDSIDSAGATAKQTNAQYEKDRQNAFDSMDSVSEFSELVGGLDPATTAYLTKQTKGMKPDQIREILTRFVDQGANTNAGNFIDGTTKSKFGALSTLLGLVNDKSGFRDGQADFTKTKGAGAYEFNDRLGTLKDVAAMDAAMARAKNAYAAQQQALQQSFGSAEASSGLIDPVFGALLKEGYSKEQAIALQNAFKDGNKTLADFTTFRTPDQATYASLVGVDPQLYSNLSKIAGFDTNTDWGAGKSGYTVNRDALNKLLVSGGPAGQRAPEAGQLAIDINPVDGSAFSKYNPEYIQQLLQHSSQPLMDKPNLGTAPNSGYQSISDLLGLEG